MRVAAALQLAAAPIVSGVGFGTIQLCLTSGLLSTVVAEVTVVVNRAAAVQVLQEWASTKKKNIKLRALELTAAHVHNALFGGIRF